MGRAHRGAVARGRSPLKRLAHYTLLEELARGGMGVVYRAHDPNADRAVAIKILLGYEGEVDPEALERFQREAEGLGRIRHPHVLRVHDFGWEQGKPYLVTDLVEGESLREVLRRGPLPGERARALLILLADAVQAVHEVGVLHRDLKPDNVILRAEDGEPVLIDFGLARLSGRQSLTASGTALGTPSYMAPELVRGEKGQVGAETDVYGLGAILYELLTGRPPFVGASALAIMSQVWEDEVQPPSAVREGVDPFLESVVVRCLAKDPDARYPTARALREALAVRAVEAPGDRSATSHWRVAVLACVLGVIVPLLGIAWLGDADAVDDIPPGPAVVGSATPAQPPVDEAALPTVAKLVAAGWVDLERGAFGPARTAFESALAVDPQARRARVGLAWVLEEWGDPRAALEQLEALDEDRVDSEVLELMAELQLAMGRLEDAEASAHRAAQLDSARPQSQIALARVFERQRKGEQAEISLDLAMGLAQREGMAAVRAKIQGVRSERYLLRGRLKAGFAAAEQAVKADPRGVQARLRLAVAYYARREELPDGLKRALKLIGELIAEQPENVRLLTTRGLARAENGDLPGALQDLEAALRLWPGHPAAHAQRARAFMLSAQRADGVEAKASAYAQAEEAARSALASNPRHAYAHGLLCSIFESQQRWDEWLTTAREGAAQAPWDNNLAFHYGRAFIRNMQQAVLERGPGEPSEDDLEALRVSAQPARDAVDAAFARMTTGRAQRAVVVAELRLYCGDLEAAKQALRADRAPARRWGRANLWNAISICEERDGKAEQAIASAQAGVKPLQTKEGYPPRSTPFLLRLADLEARRGKSAAELTWLRAAVKASPGSVPLRLRLGKQLLAGGHVKSAKSHLEIGLRRRPGPLQGELAALAGDACFLLEQRDQAARYYARAIRARVKGPARKRAERQLKEIWGSGWKERLDRYLERSGRKGKAKPMPKR